MDHIQKAVAEMAIRLLALPTGVVAGRAHDLAEIERLARIVLGEVVAARAAIPPPIPTVEPPYLPGERSGVWRAVRTNR
jgi:hypothetical protein